MKDSNTHLQTIFAYAPFLAEHLFYLCYAGSHSYGMATETSDVDLRGICFSPRDAIFGLEEYEQTILDVPDTVVYSWKKYFRLAMKGNPNIIELLFVEPEHLVVCNEWGKMLRERRELFLSKRLYHSYGGYAIGNIRKLSARRQEKGTDGTYDYKDATHLVRLLQQGTELLATGHLQVQRPNVAELFAIKRGEWPLDQLLAYAEELHEQMKMAYERSALPDEPERERIYRLAREMGEGFY